MAVGAVVVAVSDRPAACLFAGHAPTKMAPVRHISCWCCLCLGSKDRTRRGWPAAHSGPLLVLHTVFLCTEYTAQQSPNCGLWSRALAQPAHCSQRDQPTQVPLDLVDISHLPIEGPLVFSSHVGIGPMDAVEVCRNAHQTDWAAGSRCDDSLGGPDHPSLIMRHRFAQQGHHHLVGDAAVGCDYYSGCGVVDES